VPLWKRRRQRKKSSRTREQHYLKVSTLLRIAIYTTELQEAKNASWSNPKSGLTLHELLASLPDVSNALEQQDETTKTGLTIVERNQILQKGRTDFGLVLGHPQFQANPLGTIREHLTNVIAKSQSEKEIRKDMKDFEARHQPVKPKAEGPGGAGRGGKGKGRDRGKGKGKGRGRRPATPSKQGEKR
jgi:hypothetical protein